MDFEWIWTPRLLQNHSQKSFEPSRNHSPEPTQYSAFRMMHPPLPITLFPGPAGWAQPLNSIVIVEFWTSGCQGPRLLEFWNSGILGCWNSGNLEIWNFGILEFWNSGIRILELWNSGTPQMGNFEGRSGKKSRPSKW